MAELPPTAGSIRENLNRKARIAGALYLLATILGPFSLIYVPSVLFVPGNAAATAEKIRAHEMLLRLGVVGDMLTGLVFLFVVLALYRLLCDVDRNLAVVMVILGGVIPLPIFCLNALHWVAALILVHGADFLTAFTQDQRYALAMLFIRLHSQGNIINSIFWGAWLFPFGLLVMRSGFLPRVLGIWLLLNGSAYLITCFTGLLSPQHLALVNNVTQPALFGEVAIMVWLLLRGAKVSVKPRTSL